VAKAKRTFGSELRRLRREAGLTLADLADAISSSIVYVSDMERDRKNPPSAKKIEKLLARMDRLEMLQEMLRLAARSRKSIEISVDNKSEDEVNILVALARQSDEGGLGDTLIRELRRLLERGKQDE
jgi:transcriptional regulator with XRE-family HTH domain